MLHSITGLDLSILIDLNLLALRRKQWSLPTEDFSHENRRFDVKSNLYYSSRRELIGLRGFQLQTKRRASGAELAGIVFHGKSDNDASWSFVGFCDEDAIPQTQERAAPYSFALPDRLHFKTTSDPNALVGATELLQAYQGDGTAVFRAADRDAVLRSLEARTNNHQLTERVLWDEATRGLMELRSSGRSAHAGREYLKTKRLAAESPFWFFRMASIGGRPLLSRWIEEVLTKLNDEWDSIQCPACRKQSGLTIEPHRITDAGTVTGKLNCSCGAQSNNAALITHCWGCGTYPLVIGRDGPHGGSCFGLLCKCGQCRCTNQRTTEQ